MKSVTKLNDLIRYQYSWILVPTLIILFIIYPNYRNYIQYLLFSAGTVGIIIAFHIPLKLQIINFIGHLPTFFWLIYGFKYLTIDKITFILYLFCSFLIFYIPFWPYVSSRKWFVKIFTITSITYVLLYYLKMYITV